MKRLLTWFLIFFSLYSYAQIDSAGRFYAENGQIFWRAEYLIPEMDIERTKQQLLEKLESIDGFEVINSSNPNIIRAKMTNVVAVRRQVLYQDVLGAYSANIRIEVKNEGYKVQLSSIYYYAQTQALAGNSSFSLEKLLLRYNGKFREESAKNLKGVDDIFEGHVRLPSASTLYPIIYDGVYSTMKLENQYQNGYSFKSSKSIEESYSTIRAFLKEKGFDLEEDKSKFYLLAKNDKLKGSYCAEIGKGQLSSYDKYVVVTRCYSRSTDSFAPVTDLKANWQVQVMQDKDGTAVQVRMDNYTISRRTQKEILCPDAEVRSTGVLEKQIATAIK